MYILRLLSTHRYCLQTPLEGSYWPGDLQRGGLQDQVAADGRAGRVERKGAGQHYTTERVPGGVRERDFVDL